MYGCLQNLEIKVNEIYEPSTTQAQIKGHRQMMDASKSIDFINEKFDEFEVDLKEKKREPAQLKEDLKSLYE